MLDQDGLREKALRLLAARGISTAELREKLQRRAENAADVDTVIAKLKEYGYLDDKRFAEGYATARLQSDGLGKQRVLRDLRQKRVAASTAERAVQQTFAGTDETKLIEAYLARKFRHANLGEMLAEPKKLAGVYRRLRYAGFASGPAIEVLKRYAREADELESLEDQPGD